MPVLFAKFVRAVFGDVGREMIVVVWVKYFIYFIGDVSSLVVVVYRTRERVLNACFTA